MLIVKDLSVSYGETAVLKNINLEVGTGEIVAVIGSNGAGKTTLLKTISGLLRPVTGTVSFNGQDITHEFPSVRVKTGISHIPEGRQLFSGMTVRENLLMGAYKCSDRREVMSRLEWVFELFSPLKKLEKTQSGLLSGGEQQMCAIGRGLMGQPELLMIDEMSAGLAPIVVEQLSEGLRKIHDTLNFSILLVDQDVYTALELASRGFVIESGKIVLRGPSKELMENPEVKSAYLGI